MPHSDQDHRHDRAGAGVALAEMTYPDNSLFMETRLSASPQTGRREEEAGITRQDNSSRITSRCRLCPSQRAWLDRRMQSQSGTCGTHFCRESYLIRLGS